MWHCCPLAQLVTSVLMPLFYTLNLELYGTKQPFCHTMQHMGTPGIFTTAQQKLGGPFLLQTITYYWRSVGDKVSQLHRTSGKLLHINNSSVNPQCRWIEYHCTKKIPPTSSCKAYRSKLKCSCKLNLKLQIGTWHALSFLQIYYY